MRFFINSVLTLIVGIFAASGISWLIGLIWPAARTPVFIVLALSWLWLGWRYAQARDRGHF
jgi:membrane protein implicated in regulation of membrane protease activity